jgi:hypothetical protein
MRGTALLSILPRLVILRRRRARPRLCQAEEARRQGPAQEFEEDEGGQIDWAMTHGIGI